MIFIKQPCSASGKHTYKLCRSVRCKLVSMFFGRSFFRSHYFVKSNLRYRGKAKTRCAAGNSADISNIKGQVLNFESLFCRPRNSKNSRNGLANSC